MYVQGYLQGSENGRVVTIGDKRHIAISVYRSPDMSGILSVCTRKSTGQSFEWCEHVLSE
jgi:hypothetical protein